jgi:hypothetical protein
MSRLARRISVAIVILVATLGYSQAQFGKNRISYQSFEWQVYRSPHFDIHYSADVEPFLEDVVSYAESAYVKLSESLDHELRFRVPMILYSTHGEFVRTNISMSNLEGAGAFAEPAQNRVVLPIDLPPDTLYKLITHELTHIFEFSLFFDGYLGRAIRSNAPTWITEGLASYLGDDEDSLAQMIIRDAVVNGTLPSIRAFSQQSYLAYRYGHAAFDFIEQEYGLEGLRNFLFEFNKVLLTGNVSKAIKESFGYEIDEFDRRFIRYLRKKYYPVLLENKSPEDYGTEIGFKKPGTVTIAPTISPSGELVAVLGLKKIETDIFTLSVEDGSIVKNLTKGWTNRYESLPSLFNIGDIHKRKLSWSPVADEVAVFVRKEDGWPLVVFDALNGKVIHFIKLDNLYELASPTFSPDGRRIAFEGNRDGVVDIFEIDLDTQAVSNLTQDDFFDTNPWYSPDGSSLLYNRRIGSHWKVFSVDHADASRKTQLTFGPGNDMGPSYARDGESVFFSSDRSAFEIYNIYQLDLDSGDLRQYTDVVGGCFAPVEMAERDGERQLVFQAYFERSFRLYRLPLNDPEHVLTAADHISGVAEIQPFAPPLKLSIDENEKKPYKAKWDIEAPSIAIGVADDGTFLASGSVLFSDLMGNQRAILSANTVADFATIQAAYYNLRHRYTWGVQAMDFQDFIYTAEAGGTRRRNEYRYTGANMLFHYPVSRHYRIETSIGAADTSQLQPFFNPATGFYIYDNIDLTVATAGVALVGDTTRFQSYGPYQGKRFRLSVDYAAQIAGDKPTGSNSDQLLYRGDFRFYKQLTRRSLLAWRTSSIYSVGDLSNSYGFGGNNQLRGWDYREFNGSRLAWSNLEYRFPLVDEMRFPFLSLLQIRGFIFLDVGAAWFNNDLFYDPAVRTIRVRDNGAPVSFKFWDSDENRLMDGRASYGVGFQFLFIGGWQFNWAFVHRLPHTQYKYAGGFVDEIGGVPITFEKDGGDTRTEFYIIYDF